MQMAAMAAALAGFVAMLGGLAAAQHQGDRAHAPASGAVTETRALVALPAVQVDRTLANMRDHLHALQQIQDALALGDGAAAGAIAEERLGMSSLELHGAHDVAPFMPQGMREIGSSMHRAASRFAIAAQDADVTGELKPALSALADVISRCVGCHAGYRLR